MADNTNTTTNDEKVQIELSTQEPTDTTQEKLYMKILRDYNETEHDGLMTLSNTDSTQDVLYPVTRVENVVDSTGKSLDTTLNEIKTIIDEYSPINGIINEYQVASGTNVSAGDFVQYVNEQSTFYDGGIGYDTHRRIGGGVVKAVKLNDTDVLLNWVGVDNNLSKPDIEYMVVYRFSDKQISIASVVNVANTLSETFSYAECADIPMGTNKFLHFYQKRAESVSSSYSYEYFIYCRIVSWNGSELSFETETQVFSFYVNESQFFGAIKVNDNGKCLLLYQGKSGTQLTGAILTVASGSLTPTINTPVLLSVNDATNLGGFACGEMLNDSKCLVVSRWNWAKVVSFIVDVSGNSPTISSTDANLINVTQNFDDFDNIDNGDLIVINEQYAVLFIGIYKKIDNTTYKFYTMACPIEIDSSFSTNLGEERQVSTILNEYEFAGVVDKGNRDATLVCSTVGSNTGNMYSLCDICTVEVHINDFEMINDKQYTDISINGEFISHGTEVMQACTATKMSDDGSIIAIPYVSSTGENVQAGYFTAALGVLCTDLTKRKGIIPIEDKEKVLGIAKTAGTSGANINVYVPNVTI